jgi:hypothetical protein
MIEYKLFVNDEVYKRYYEFIKNRIKSNRKWNIMKRELMYDFFNSKFQFNNLKPTACIICKYLIPSNN